MVPRSRELVPTGRDSRLVRAALRRPETSLAWLAAVCGPTEGRRWAIGGAEDGSALTSSGRTS
jgi:hypothetical protein